jgi:hypothetical protein
MQCLLHLIFVRVRTKYRDVYRYNALLFDLSMRQLVDEVPKLSLKKRKTEVRESQRLRYKW